MYILNADKYFFFLHTHKIFIMIMIRFIYFFNGASVKTEILDFFYT